MGTVLSGDHGDGSSWFLNKKLPSKTIRTVPVVGAIQEPSLVGAERGRTRGRIGANKEATT